MNEISVVAPGAGAPAITMDRLDDYLSTFTGANALTKPERTQFTEMCMAYKLDPFKREIYPIAYGSGQYRKLSIIVGYEVYLKRAERTGKLDGWEVTFSGSLESSKKSKRMGGQWKEVDAWIGDLTATIKIYRKDWSRPLVHDVYWEEYTQDNSMWFDKPKTMLRKVAIGQGFRLCFPDELGGMGYLEEEVPGHQGFEDAKPVGPKPPTPVSTPTVKSYSKTEIVELQKRYLILKESLEPDDMAKADASYAKHRNNGAFLEKLIESVLNQVQQSEGEAEPQSEDKEANQEPNEPGTESSTPPEDETESVPEILF
jgi:phage recombination protein Bet